METEQLFDINFEEDSELGDNVEDDLQLLLQTCRENSSELDLEVIKNAFYFCVKSHENQFRKSGKPYYTHPLNVALILIKEFPKRYDTETVAACLLHDTIEDTKHLESDKRVDEKKIESFFGDVFGHTIARLIVAVTNIKHKETSRLSSKASTHRKLFLALVDDVRVVVIKLADRLHNMRTMHYMKSHQQIRIAEETLNFYTPLAHRLGLTKVKMELEDRSLYFSNYIMYDKIKKVLYEKRLEFVDYIRVFSEHISDNLNKHNIPHILTVVHKHFYEIYQMVESGRELEKIDNFYSLVINLESDDKFECYKVHGILVNAFSPVERLVDYVAQPKINWYMSLNTHLVGPDGKIVEVLIRTREMARLADEGILTFFSEEGKKVRAFDISDKDIQEWGEWMQDIIEEEGEDAQQIIWDSIKNNIFDRDIVVYTTNGKKIPLPMQSTPIDLAFAISKETGLNTISVKVNGEVKNLNYELSNGDRVEIISSENSKPDKNWLEFVVYYKAVVSLHKYFKNNLINDNATEQEEKLTEVIIRVFGEDRPGMLHDITNAIGKSNINRINLGTSEDSFEGALNLSVKNEIELSHLIIKLTSIKGIRKIQKIED